MIDQALTWVVVGDHPDAIVLAEHLGHLRMLHLDDLPEIEPVDEWRPSSVVLCTWPGPCAPIHALDIDDDAFGNDVERPLGQWILALARLARWCADGGSVAVLVERPAGLDTPGRLAHTVLAEGLIAYARSLAHAEGARGVRVNTITTTRHTAPEVLLGQQPPLATFPGRVEAEIVGAVRMLLGPDACGITAATLHADCGRSW